MAISNSYVKLPEDISMIFPLNRLAAVARKRTAVAQFDDLPLRLAFWLCRELFGIRSGNETQI
jgi:hypothetical protein